MSLHWSTPDSDLTAEILVISKTKVEKTLLLEFVDIYGMEYRDTMRFCLCQIGWMVLLNINRGLMLVYVPFLDHG